MGDILKNFKEGQQCEPRYQALSLCHTYFFKEFNSYPSVLNIKHDDYLKTIKEKNFHDPILTYVALYLYHNYEIAQNYFSNDSNHKNNAACAVLNRWLDQEKNFYTNFGRCYYNLHWWNISIEPLWQKLESYYTNKSCKRYNSYYYKDAPLRKYKDEDRCYKQQVEEHVCFKKDDDDKNSIKENCDKLSILYYLGEVYKLLDGNTGTTSTTPNNYCSTNPTEKINYNPVLKAEKSYFCESLINTIVLPISATVLGTIFLAFFLNEFTPLGNKFQTRTKNKLRLREQFNGETGYNEYQTYRNNNQSTYREKNTIYYQSMNE